MIKGVSKVVIDVEDQERAKVFWTTTMSFEVVQDAPYGEERWLEVRSPDNATILVLGRSSTGPGDRESVPEMLPTSCSSTATTYSRPSRRCGLGGLNSLNPRYSSRSAGGHFSWILTAIASLSCRLDSSRPGTQAPLSAGIEFDASTTHQFKRL